MHWRSYRSRQIGGVVGIVGLLLLGLTLGVTHLLKTRKGSLTISLHQSEIRAGGTIAGVVRIDPRQDLTAERITLVLVCRETWDEVRYDSEGYEETRSQSRERHSQTLTITEAMQLVAGQEQEVPFELPLPATLPQAEGSRARRSRSSGEVRGRRSWVRSASRLQWKLTANMELAGIDLDTTHHF